MMRIALNGTDDMRSHLTNKRSDMNSPPNRLSPCRIPQHPVHSKRVPVRYSSTRPSSRHLISQTIIRKKDLFEEQVRFGVKIRLSRHPDLNAYIDTVLDAIKPNLHSVRNTSPSHRLIHNLRQKMIGPVEKDLLGYTR